MNAPNKPSGELVKCPLCEGRGELPERDLFDRLSEKDFPRKVSSYLANFVEPEINATEHDTPVPAGDFQKDVNSWNCTHFLWRRSPKE